MRRAIVTSVIGDRLAKLAALTVPTQREYAKRIGAEFIILKKNLPGQEKEIANWSKFCIYDMLKPVGLFDEILWLDADIAVSPKAENIFNVAGGKFAAFAEGDVVERMTQFREYYAVLKGWVMPEPEKFHYINSGVFVIPASAREVFARPDNLELQKTVDLRNERYNVYFFDQNMINMRLVDLKIAITRLMIFWNAMHVPCETFGLNWSKRAEFAHMIHYAGLLACMGDKVLDLVREDLQKWGVPNG